MSKNQRATISSAQNTPKKTNSIWLYQYAENDDCRKTLNSVVELFNQPRDTRKRTIAAFVIFIFKIYKKYT